MTGITLSWLARFATIATIALALQGCQKKTEDHMAAARAAMAAKDPTTAVVHLKNVLAADPNNAEGRLLLGLQELAAGDTGAAVIDLKRARELKVPDDQVVPALAEALLASGQGRLLIEQFGQVKLASPEGMVRLQTALGMAYLGQANAPLARKSIETALAQDPKNKESKLALAKVTRADSTREAALVAVDALVQENPTYDDAWAYKGYLHELNFREPDLALAAYAKALQTNDKHLQSLFSVVTIHMVKGDLKTAKEYLDKLIKAWPKSLLTLYLQARMSHLNGDYAAARTQFTTLLNALPENVLGLLASGINELKLSSPIQAEAQLARAVSLDPNNIAARYYLAQANMQLGRPERASNALAPLLENPNAVPEVLVVGAQAKLLQGDTQGAEDLYARAERFKSKDPGVRTALAVAQVARGQMDAALRELQQISESTQGIDADLKLVTARLMRNDLNEALSAIEKLEAKQPNLAAAAELKGQVLLKRKDEEGARKAFELALTREKAYAPALIQLTNLDLAQRKSEAARKRLDDLLAANPNNAAALAMRAGVVLRTGEPAANATALLERATKADPLDLNAWLMLMSRHFNAGDVQAALVASQSANVAIPDNIQIMEMTGRIQLKSGDLRQANKTFSDLTRIAPRSASGYMGLATTLVAANELEPAAKTLQRLIDMEPRYADALRMAAEVATRRRQFPEALTMARNLQKMYPNDAVGYAVEGESEFAQSHWAAAAAAFSKGLGKTNGIAMPMRVHEAFLRDGKSAAAEQLEGSWLASHPKDTAFLAYLGDYALATKNFAAARKRYEQVLAIDPKNVGTLNNMAWLMLQAKEPGAQVFAERALAESPDRPEVLDTYAQILASQKMYPKAVEALKRAINRSTDIAPLQLALAKVYIQAEDRANATAELERLVALGKSSPYYAQARKLLAEQNRR